MSDKDSERVGLEVAAQRTGKNAGDTSLAAEIESLKIMVAELRKHDLPTKARMMEYLKDRFFLHPKQEDSDG